MKKILLLLTITFTIFSCQSSSDSTSLQENFLKEKIASTLEKLVSKVEETGYSLLVGICNSDAGSLCICNANFLTHLHYFTCPPQDKKGN